MAREDRPSEEIFVASIGALGKGADLARHWWLVGLHGLLAVFFGLLALFWTGAALLSLILVFGAFRLVDGIFNLAAAARAGRAGRRWGLLAFIGLLDLVIAAIAFSRPWIAMITLVFLVAAGAIVSGGWMLSAAWRLEKGHGNWLLVLGGLLSLAFGLVLLFSPLTGAIVLTWWIGAWALATGFFLIVAAFRLHRRHAERPQGRRDGLSSPA